MRKTEYLYPREYSAEGAQLVNTSTLKHGEKVYSQFKDH